MRSLRRRLSSLVASFVGRIRYGKSRFWLPVRPGTSRRLMGKPKTALPGAEGLKSAPAGATAGWSALGAGTQAQRRPCSATKLWRNTHVTGF